MDRRFIEHRWSALDGDGNVIRRGFMIVGRDPSDQKIKWWEFDNWGVYTEAVMTQCSDQKCVWSAEGTLSDGTKRKATITFGFPGKNSYTWAISYENGEENQGTFQRARRKKDAWPRPQVGMPDGVGKQLREMEWWAGDSILEGSDPLGNSFVGQSKCQWALDGKFLLYESASVDADLETSRYRAVVGVDPSTNQVTGWEFESIGFVGKYVVSDKGHDVKGSGSYSDGMVIKFAGRLEEPGENAFEYRATAKSSAGTEVRYHGKWKKKAAKEE
ncbi:MAG: hypothetical protein ACYTG0_35595 [Planctomycetota bacterium]